MDATSRIFSFLVIRPHTITELVAKMDYSTDSIYKSIHHLHSLGLIEKQRMGRTSLLLIARGHGPRKLQGFFLGSMSCGLDPSKLMKDPVLKVLKVLDGSYRLKEIMEGAGYGYRRTRSALKTLEEYGLITRISSKPLVVEPVFQHPVYEILTLFIDNGFQKENEGKGSRKKNGWNTDIDMERNEKRLLDEEIPFEHY